MTLLTVFSRPVRIYNLQYFFRLRLNLFKTLVRMAHQAKIIVLHPEKLFFPGAARNSFSMYHTFLMGVMARSAKDRFIIKRKFHVEPCGFGLQQFYHRFRQCEKVVCPTRMIMIELFMAVNTIKGKLILE